MSAYEIHGTLCWSLNATAYGTAYNSLGSGIGTYNGSSHYDFSYYALASGSGAVYGTPAYMHCNSILEHVYVHTYHQGPFVETP